MRSARFELALEVGLLPLPSEGLIAVWRPVMGDDLSALPKDRVVVLTGFRPDHDHFAAQGYATEAEGPFAASVICLPRARDHARAMLSEAEARTLPGGPVMVDGQKTDGIDSMLKELRRLLPQDANLSEVLAKAHGKTAVFPAGKTLVDWQAKPQEIDGFTTRPGVFSADGPDTGSQLLAAALPAKLGPKVADLGAGWGYLSRAILAREGVKKLELVEAEATSLDCAKQNIDDPRASFHWADARSFRPATLVQTVVMNPPFHSGRKADPALGIAFIAAARRMLTPDGALYMVANRHLPYDEALAQHFLLVEDIGGTNAFRLIRAAKPRRPDRKV